ncbi:MAG TPA: class I SAM-dependent methyltransferase [Lysobacter sp.]|nr:class I SAM-dependent methyltransferase [Lysobacter sp.]
MIRMPLLRGALLLALPLAAACSERAADRAAPPVASPATTSADAAATAPAAVPPAATTTRPATREPDVIYVPTPESVVDAMLDMADVKRGDVIYDLGSGDGRIPIRAAKLHGTRGVGIDINPERIREANENARKAGVTHLVTFRQEDLFEADIDEASVVTLYLLESLNLKLRPKLLAELKPGTRIVSHAFSMGDWKPKETRTVDGRTVYLWVVPERGR